MQVRTRLNFGNIKKKKEKELDIKTPKFFLLFIGLVFGIEAAFYFGIIGFVIWLGTYLSILKILSLYSKSSFYNFTHSKTQDRYISANFLHHQKYYHDPELIQYLQKSIWKEYYQLPFLYKAFGVLGSSIMLLIFTAGIMDEVSKNISVFTNIIVMIATFGQLFLAFVLIFFLRKKYKNDIKHTGNKYLFKSIGRRSYSVSGKANKQGWNDYILEKI